MLLFKDIENQKDVSIYKKDDGYYWENHKLECKFFEFNHTYWLGYTSDLTKEDSVFYKVRQLTSVTTLMKKHKLIQDYGRIPEYILRRKAKFGTLIHKELERWAKYNEIGFSDELQLFINFSKINDIKPLQSEYIVYNDVVAGTVDVECMINGFQCKADYKTTTTYDEEYLSWQLSIYNYLDNHKDEKLICFHFHNNTLDMYEVPVKNDEEIEALFEAERKEKKDVNN